MGKVHQNPDGAGLAGRLPDSGRGQATPTSRLDQLEHDVALLRQIAELALERGDLSDERLAEVELDVAALLRSEAARKRRGGR